MTLSKRTIGSLVAGSATVIASIVGYFGLHSEGSDRNSITGNNNVQIQTGNSGRDTTIQVSNGELSKEEGEDLSVRMQAQVNQSRVRAVELGAKVFCADSLAKFDARLNISLGTVAQHRYRAGLQLMVGAYQDVMQIENLLRQYESRASIIRKNTQSYLSHYRDHRSEVVRDGYSVIGEDAARKLVQEGRLLEAFNGLDPKLARELESSLKDYKSHLTVQCAGFQEYLEASNVVAPR